MTETELYERHEILVLAQKLRPSPQCIALSVRQPEMSSKYIDIPVVSIASCGTSGCSRFHNAKRAIMQTLEESIMCALARAYEGMRALALDEEARP